MHSSLIRRASSLCSRLPSRVHAAASSYCFVSPPTLLNSLHRRHAHFDTSVGISDEQLEYQKLASQFAVDELAPHAAKWDAEHFFPVDTLRKAAALGFGGIYVREDVGGTGLGRLDAALIFEALAVGDVSSSAYLTIHNMVAWMIDTFGNEEQRQRYLPEMVNMNKFASYCLTEPGSGSDAASLVTSARKDGDHYVMNGSKAFISGAGVSEIYIIMARTGGAGPKGISAFIVDKATPGISFGKLEDKMGWNNQPTRAVLLEDCRVHAKQMLGKEGDGFTIAMKGLDGGRINIGTTSLGGAISCFNATMDHVNIRKQFDRPLAAFQNTQFQIADMGTQITAARLMVQQAARLLDAKHPSASMHCAMAKRFATDTGFNVANQCMQLFGGYGYLKDYPIERVLRDVRVHQILEGTNQIMNVIAAKHLMA